MTRVISFSSYKGGAGRSFVTANVAEALILQGMNVVVVDLDLEAPGLANFSTTLAPRSLFNPEHLFKVDYTGISRTPLIQPESDYPKPSDIKLDGLLSPFSNSSVNIQELSNLLRLAHLDEINEESNETLMRELNERIENGMKDVGVYESRSKEQHPLEGRLFIVPVGGGYNNEPHQNEQRNPWVYYPPTNAVTSDKNGSCEGEGLVSGVLQDMMYHPSVDFSNLLYDELAKRLDVEGVNIDYILLDQRAGLEGRVVLLGNRTDGIVLVTPTSRGGLKGTKKLAETIINLRRSSKKDEGGKLNAPIIGCVVSGLAPQSQPSSIGETGFEAFCANDQQVGLSKLLQQAVEHGDALLPMENCHYYFKLFESVLVSHNPFQQPTSHSYNHENVTVHQELWNQLAKISSVKMEDETVSKVIFPLNFEHELRFYDRVCSFREFLVKGGVEGFGSSEFNQLTMGLCALSAHIRNFEVQDKVDPIIECWKALKEESDSDKLPNIVPTTLPQLKQNMHWSYYWYLSLRCAIIDRDSSKQLAIEALAKMNNAQNEHIGRLVPTYNCGFKAKGNAGDWRISWLEAKMESKERNVLGALDEARQQIDYLTKASDNGEQWAWLAKCSFIREIKTSLYEQQACLYRDNEEYDIAWEKYRHCLDAIRYERKSNVLNGILDLAKKCKNDLSKSIYDELIVKLKELVLNSSLRNQLLIPYCYALLGRYWITSTKVSKPNSSDERDEAQEIKDLYKFVELMHEWKDFQAKCSIDSKVDDNFRAKALTQLGEVYLELACVDSEFGNAQSVQSALENLNEAVIWNVEKPEAWLYAVVARHFTYVNRKLIADNMEDKKGEEGKGFEIKKELAILKRDAYYAAEQLSALVGQIDWFADSDDAAKLQEIPYDIICFIFERRLDLFDCNQAKVKSWFKAFCISETAGSKEVLNKALAHIERRLAS